MKKLLNMSNEKKLAIGFILVFIIYLIALAVTIFSVDTQPTVKPQHWGF